MANLDLSPEQLELQAQAKDFALREIRPVAWELDREATWPGALLESAWAAGLRNLSLPAWLGGRALDALTICLVYEELAWGCAGITTSLSNNDLAAGPVMVAGTREQQERFLGKLIEGPAIAAFCLTEPSAGSDVASMRMRAERRGDVYVLNGSKCFITNGAYADWYTVFAKTDPGAGHRGISAFVVERDESVLIDKKEDKLGQRASNTATVTFNDTEVPAANLLGAENRGFRVAMATLDQTRPAVAAQSVGIARAAMEFATVHAAARVQSGVPIAAHQAVSGMVADMATEIEAARLLAWKSAMLLDRGDDATLLSSQAKRFAADTAMKVTTDAVQVFGGYGVSTDFPVEKLMRDAKLMQLYEGTSQIQRLVIAREIFMPRAPRAEAQANGNGAHRDAAGDLAGQG